RGQCLRLAKLFISIPLRETWTTSGSGTGPRVRRNKRRQQRCCALGTATCSSCLPILTNSFPQLSVAIAYKDHERASLFPFVGNFQIGLARNLERTDA